MAGWQNWSGSVRCAPRRIEVPRTQERLRALVAGAAKERTPVRVAGSGHSFLPLCATEGLMLSLDALQGLVAVDAAAARAQFHAGTKLHQIGGPLLGAGFAMANMGDIDQQSIAGAVSTGTHGTGRGLGSISTQIAGLCLIDGSGEAIDCSPLVEPELFNAARVSLGACGVICSVILDVLPAYRLHESTWLADFEACMAQTDTLIASNRHFEFFWVPGKDVCAIKTLNPTSLHRPPLDTADPGATGWAARYVGPQRVDWSYRIFPSVRDRLFNEQEFALPADRGVACMREIRELIRTRHAELVWPVEYRTLAADDIPLSPAYGRDSVTISVHHPAAEPFDEFFADCEAIFRNHHGRPHWGKRHTHTTSELQSLYPAWGSFHEARERIDPRRIFINNYLECLFGL